MRVGADVRICSLHASSQLGPTGKLHAFEQTRKTLDLLISNMKRGRLDNISTPTSWLSRRRVERCILWLKAGLQAVALPHMGPAQFRGNCMKAPRQKNQHEPRKKVNFIKAYIEGREKSCCEGVKRTLSEEKILILFKTNVLATLFLIAN